MVDRVERIPAALGSAVRAIPAASGYIEQVWNFEALSGVRIYGLPLEELLFGFSFGLACTGIYEHFMWKRSVTG